MLKDLFYKTRQDCWKIIAREYPETVDKYGIVQDLIARALRNGSIVLDAGCGHRSIVPHAEGMQIRLVGIDMVREDVKNNRSLAIGAIANIDHIPLRKESVDLIVCNQYGVRTSSESQDGI